MTEVRVRVPDHPPALTVEAARELLEILFPDRRPEVELERLQTLRTQLFVDAPRSSVSARLPEVRRGRVVT